MSLQTRSGPESHCAKRTQKHAMSFTPQNQLIRLIRVLSLGRNWRFLQMVLNMRRGPPDHEDEKTYGKWAKLRHKQMGQAMEDLHKSVPGKVD
eukprot:1199015-Rhodomonas_salina.1